MQQLPENTESFIQPSYPQLWGTKTFRLSRHMRDQLLADPIGSELYPLSAGIDIKQQQPRSSCAMILPGTLMAYCTAGAGTLVANDHPYKIREGDLILLEKGNQSNLVPDPDVRWTYIFILIEGDRVGLYLSRLLAYAPIVNIGVQPKLIEDMHAFVRLSEETNRLDIFVQASCQLKCLLLSLAIEVSNSLSSQLNDKLDRSKALIKNSLSGKLRLDVLANACGLSKSYYIRQFKARNAQSPMQYYLHLKMQRACDLLESSEHEVKTIAELLRYEDPNYFSRIFKKTIGVSPQRYRLNYQGQRFNLSA